MNRKWLVTTAVVVFAAALLAWSISPAFAEDQAKSCTTAKAACGKDTAAKAACCADAKAACSADAKAACCADAKAACCADAKAACKKDAKCGADKAKETENNKK